MGWGFSGYNLCLKTLVIGGVIRLIHRAYNPASGMNHEVLYGFYGNVVELGISTGMCKNYPQWGDAMETMWIHFDLMTCHCFRNTVWNKAETLRVHTVDTHFIPSTIGESMYDVLTEAWSVGLPKKRLINYPTGLQAPSDTVFGDGFWGLNAQTQRVIRSGAQLFGALGPLEI